MIPLIWPAKYGDEVLDYEVDWSARLTEDLISPGGVTATVSGNAALEVENISTVGGSTTIWISGGGPKANRTGRINLLATTSGGRSIGASVYLPVLPR